MIIDDSKKKELIEALLEKMCLAASASSSTSFMSMLTSFFIFVVVVFRHVHVRTAVGTGCGTKKTKQKCEHFGTKVNNKEQMCTKITLPNRTHKKIIHTYTLRAHFYFSTYQKQWTKTRISNNVRTCVDLFV